MWNSILSKIKKGKLLLAKKNKSLKFLHKNKTYILRRQSFLAEENYK